MVNSVMGMTGIGMILYALWMLRVWFRELHELGTHAQAPWLDLFSFVQCFFFLVEAEMKSNAVIKFVFFISIYSVTNFV